MDPDELPCAMLHEPMRGLLDLTDRIVPGSGLEHQRLMIVQRCAG